MKKRKLLVLLLCISLLTGCTKMLKNSDNQVVKNEVTGQTITENVICKPTDESTLKIYEEYEVNIEPTQQVRQLRFAIEKETKLQACRQRLWYEAKDKPVVLEVDKTIEQSGITTETVLQMKDLGPQLPFRFFYLTEYFGPLFLYIIIYFIAKAMGKITEEVCLQTTLALIMWIVHYVKRIVETIYVHEFGDMTMPIRNIFKNCTYYYGFAIAVAINVNFFPRTNCFICTVIGLIGMIASIISNGYCHIMLKRLRTPGSQEWKIPKGFLFDYITTPNYFCEIMTWFFFNVMTGFRIMGILFNLCGIYQMWKWADQRRIKYKKISSDYNVKWTLLPFIH